MSSEPLAPLALIVCHDRNRVIGKDGGMPWRYPEDLQRFKQVTTGHALVMGRKTYESIGRPLPDRRNLVISRQADYAPDGAEVFDSLEGALAAARETDSCPFVIGGAAIYALALPLATLLYVTEIDREFEGDTWFPPFDAEIWTELERTQAADGELTFRILERMD